MEPPNFTAEAACARAVKAGQIDPNEFTPDKGGDSGRARRMCRTCAARIECLNYALTHPDDAVGVYGGYRFTGQKRTILRLRRALRPVIDLRD